jgi:hypothetical protein
MEEKKIIIAPEAEILPSKEPPSKFGQMFASPFG